MVWGAGMVGGRRLAVVVRDRQHVESVLPAGDLGDRVRVVLPLTSLRTGPNSKHSQASGSASLLHRQPGRVAGDRAGDPSDQLLGSGLLRRTSQPSGNMALRGSSV